MTLEPAFTQIDGQGRVLFLCDHASNLVPSDVNDGDLGLPEAQMQRHIAYDIGALGVTRELAKSFSAPAVMSNFSRLVIDPNRGEDDPTLVRKIYDGAVIAGNRYADADEINRRLNRFYLPYHDAIRARIHEIECAGLEAVLISIHSFTPKLMGEAPRPWHYGILWDKDDRIAKPLISRLEADEGIVVGDNEPYTGELEGDCMFQHGTSHGRPHVLIELRQDLIETPEGQRLWAAHLGKALRDVLGDNGFM